MVIIKVKKIEKNTPKIIRYSLALKVMSFLKKYLTILTQI